MKFLSLILLMGTSAMAATQTFNLTVVPTQNEKGYCLYESKLSFSQFPDFNVFFQVPNTNTWRPAVAQVQATVEELSANSYVLKLNAIPEFPQKNETCPTKQLKVLVR